MDNKTPPQEKNRFYSRETEDVMRSFYNSLNENGTMILGLHETLMGPYSKHFIRKDPFYFKALP